ncbi:MAG: squalene/phytoene synthase family protein [Candidatus Aureabacteria bacterium]|nr:squalene/phytoene synthase family protein [Candidatus Auribacterota bacterium]
MNDKSVPLLIKERQFCAEILPRVSRTFAVNIGFLKGELHEAVLCSYLFCRMIDTLEDSPNLDVSQKVALLEEWSRFFPFENQPVFLQRIRLLGEQKLLTENRFETELIMNAEKVFTLYRSFATPVQEMILIWIREMAKGMAEFQTRSVTGVYPTCLKNMDDLEKYCYYVAGTVGHLLTELFCYFLQDISEIAREIMRQTANSFGLGLQITNIIKDAQSDKKRNWCFIPESLMLEHHLTPQNFYEEINSFQRAKTMLELITHTVPKLDEALSYSLAIPSEAKEIRLFCLLPVHFAIQTLVKAKKHFENKEFDQIKISRSRVKGTVILTRLTYFSDFFQRHFYRYYRNQLNQNLRIKN